MSRPDTWRRSDGVWHWLPHLIWVNEQPLGTCDKAAVARMPKFDMTLAVARTMTVPVAGTKDHTDIHLNKAEHVQEILVLAGVTAGAGKKRLHTTGRLDREGDETTDKPLGDDVARRDVGMLAHERLTYVLGASS